MAECFKIKQVPESTLHEKIKTLLMYASDTSTKNAEVVNDAAKGLDKLFADIGDLLDTPESHAQMDSHFVHLMGSRNETANALVRAKAKVRLPCESLHLNLTSALRFL